MGTKYAIRHVRNPEEETMKQLMAELEEADREREREMSKREKRKKKEDK